MSSVVARTISPAPRPVRTSPDTVPQRPSLRAVSASEVRKARPKLAYAVATVGTLVSVVAAQLVLSVALSQGAYELSSLRQQQRELGWKEASLSEQLDALTSPQYVAANAQALGMVINQSPAYLSLSTGAVLGVPGAAGEATSLPLSSSLVGNSLTDKLPLVTVPEGTAGAPDPEPVTPPVTFENGLPSPRTH